MIFCAASPSLFCTILPQGLSEIVVAESITVRIVFPSGAIEGCVVV
jgi:hypothetical protein